MTTTIPDRVPPHSEDAELSVLSSCMLNDKLLDIVEPLLRPEDFYSLGRQKIYKTMVRLRAGGSAIDMITLADELEKNDELESVGGKFALVDLSAYSVYSLDEKAIRSQCNIIRDKAKYRQMIRIGSMMMTRGYEADFENVTEAISTSVSEVMGLALSHNTSAMPIGMALDEMLRQMRSGERNYITPPHMSSARMKPGDLVVVAAGTAVGKTAITLNWADEWSKSKNVVYFEYEMPEADLTARLICKYAGVSLADVQDGNVTTEEEKRIEDAAEILRGRNLKIEEVWCDIGTLMSKIRREASQGAEVVVIDHLGLIGYNTPKGMNTAKAVGKMVTNPLKNLASELNITIVILVQLNREGQKEDFPRLWHLRDSGEIEQDASVVLMLWSENALGGDTTKRIKVREDCGILEEHECYEFGDKILIRVSVEKNRNGMTFSKFLLYHGPTFSYEDRSDEEETAWKTKTLC